MWRIFRKSQGKEADRSVRPLVCRGHDSYDERACIDVLEHVPRKRMRFRDQNMLQLIDFERFLIDWVIPSNRKML
jgi:hypothetical protein